MQSFMSRIGAVLGTLAVLGLTAPAFAGQDLPFTSEGTFSVDSVQGNQVITMGAGQASYLGAFNGVNDIKVKGNGDAESVLTLVGANGDSIVMATATSIVGPGQRAGVYVVLGGTGRFAGATGSGTLLVLTNADGTFDQTLSGRISF